MTIEEAIAERDAARAHLVTANERIKELDQRAYMYWQRNDDIERALVDAKQAQGPTSLDDVKRVLALLTAERTAHEATRAERDRLAGEVAGLRRFVASIRDHGLKCDLQPTMKMDGSATSVYVQFSRYLARIDAGLRDDAHAALFAATKEPANG